MALPKPECPAATVQAGTVLQPLPIARCEVSGMVQMAADSPCCGEYTRCPVWRKEKERGWANKRTHRSTEKVNTGSGEWE